MNLVKVDHINVQPAQTIVAFAADGIGLQRAVHVSLLVPAQTALGENVRPRSGPGPQRKRDDFFGVAHSVNSGGVNPVNAKIQCTMNRRDRLLIVLFTPAKFPTGTPDSPCAKAYGRDG